MAVQAYLAESVGRVRSARELYERALYLDARSARSYALYARCLLAQAADGVDSEGAQRARLVLDRALEIDPQHAGLRSMRASSLPW